MGYFIYFFEFLILINKWLNFFVLLKSNILQKKKWNHWWIWVKDCIFLKKIFIFQSTLRFFLPMKAYLILWTLLMLVDFTYIYFLSEKPLEVRFMISRLIVLPTCDLFSVSLKSLELYIYEDICFFFFATARCDIAPPWTTKESRRIIFFNFLLSIC